MRFEGKVIRDGRFWLAEIPLLDAITQGKTRAEALAMIADWLETMILAWKSAADPMAKEKLAKRKQMLRTVWSDYS